MLPSFWMERVSPKFRYLWTRQYLFIFTQIENTHCSNNYSKKNCRGSPTSAHCWSYILPKMTKLFFSQCTDIAPYSTARITGLTRMRYYHLSNGSLSFSGSLPKLFYALLKRSIYLYHDINNYNIFPQLNVSIIFLFYFVFSSPFSLVYT